MANVQAVKSLPTVAICPHFTSTLACPSLSTPNILVKISQIFCCKFYLPCPLTQEYFGPIFQKIWSISAPLFIPFFILHIFGSSSKSINTTDAILPIERKLCCLMHCAAALLTSCKRESTLEIKEGDMQSLKYSWKYS